ncbi:MAG: lytic transglycosylase domain-containing protein [Candidatus Woesearchaeota archaeon]
MNIVLNKKGIIVPLMAIFALILFVSAAVMLYGTENITEERTIGKIQIELIKLYQEGERILFYIDESAKNAEYNSLIDLGKNGGYYKTDCEKVNEYYLWNNNCKPHYKESFENYFKDNLNLYLIKYPNKELKIDYDIKLDNNYIIGEPKDKYYSSYQKAKVDEKIVSKYDSLIKKASIKYNIDENLIKKIIQRESKFNANAISSVGAAGLMQLMPGTARDMGLIVTDQIDERLDPEKNIDAGTKYIKKQLDFFKDERVAIASYNAGPGRVQGWMECINLKNALWSQIVSDKRIIITDKPKKTEKCHLPLQTYNYVNFVEFGKSDGKLSLTMDYSINPYFKQKMFFDLDDYQKIINEIDNSKSCFKTADNLNSCIKNNDFIWNIKKEGNNIFFDVTTKNKVLYEPITIKFFIKLEEGLFV